ncbi:unnamed protein product [Paramecium sonneborni]|uniref:Uncharacterized protein n=1 Tax=Paramecium sonneborni TaxID=65129 RepID=A0A8S1LP89_9CILI|nr:unnamed protein product [Paramecium sonneborni]
MKFQTQAALEPKIWKIGTREYDIDCWNQMKMQNMKTKILITITQDYSIIYSKDGQILRIQQFSNYEEPEILTNLELIKHFKCQIQSRNDQEKFVRQTATWYGTPLQEVCGYFEGGLKQGIWSQTFKNYRSQAEIYEVGEYYNDVKNGQWKYIYKNKIIGGGKYNENQQKDGKWIDLSESFMDQSQVTYIGDYSNGKKVGRWDINWNWDEQNLQIGGGSYKDEQHSSTKIGMWIELVDNFRWDSQVIYKGEYKNGQKIGRWDIMYKRNDNFELIGGGQFDDKNGISIKIGRWIELSNFFSDYSQVTYEGFYKEGHKVGRWDNFLKFGGKNELIGGGQYVDDAEQNNIKIGMWIELWDEFKKDSQIIYKGEYKNGQKIGRWDILYRRNDRFRQIGGGQYDECLQEGLKKIGKWIELSEGFYDYSQVIQTGEYINGFKFGRWDVLYRQKMSDQFEQIGGGLYENDKEIGAIKVGKWIELSDEFKWDSQFIYTGEYKNANKVGIWDEMVRDRNNIEAGFQKMQIKYNIKTQKSKEIQYDN